MSDPTRIDVHTFAELVGRSKRQIYKHIKAGTIPAVKPNRNSAYEIERAEVERFLCEYGDNGSSNEAAPHRDQARTDTGDSSPRGHRATRPDVNPSPPAEVYGMLVDRLTRAERKNVELEILLRQHQNLLTENAESLQEDRAKALEQQERVKERDEENAQLRAELESLRTDLATREAEWSEQRRPWWKRMWGKPDQ